jgi:dTDP-4-dehydrorhamnose 3,5-epimerase
MKFRETPLSGAFVVDIEPHADERGFFARTWCSQEFAGHGLEHALVQASISQNVRRGTVRGMHLQLPPSHESKFVRCTRGAIYDVIIDLRPESPTYLQHFGVELEARTWRALYIPPLMAHGFQTLADDTEVLYQMTDVHVAQLGFGVRWNDPAFAIQWPIKEQITILGRDRDYADFDAQSYAMRLGKARGSSLNGVRPRETVP